MTAQDNSRRRMAFDPQPFKNKKGALRVLLVHKKSRIELQKIDPAAASEEMRDEHNQHQRCLKSVRDFLLSQNVTIEDTYRDDLSQHKTSGCIVVTVGGDGTALGTSHHVATSPIFAVNSDPRRSVGTLCVGDENNFATLFAKLEEEKLDTLAVARMGGTLDGKELDAHALNDILVAHQNPAAMSRYSIEFDGVTEEHKSSGIWIATPMGSTGAIMSAGGHIQPLDDTRLQFAVREPYLTVGRPNRLLSGSLAHDATLQITSRMSDGKIFIDGPHFIRRFSAGSTLEVHARGLPLLLFVSDEMEYRRRQIASLRESVA